MSMKIFGGGVYPKISAADVPAPLRAAGFFGRRKFTGLHVNFLSWPLPFTF
jgi:hypothetical protein